MNTKTYTDIAAQPGVCNGVFNQCGQDTYQTGSFTNQGPINSSGQIVGQYTNSISYPNLFVYGGGSTSVVTTPATNTTTDLTGSAGSTTTASSWGITR